MSFEKVYGVLLNLNDAEREVFQELLNVAERHVDEVPLMTWDSGRHMNRQTTEGVYRGMIRDLRATLGLPGPTEEGIDEDKRLRRAVQRDDAHVSPRRIVCAYDRCNESIRGETKNGKSLWEQAREKGWKIVWKDSLGTDLYCPFEHDKYGNVIYPD